LERNTGIDMIIHGRKQISEIVYARKASDGGGALRLSNIIRGPQVVFGGLAPLGDWLKIATKQAILAAFGVLDGNAVILATVAYLNQLAATDPTKASALADVLNANPQHAVMAKYVADYGDSFAHMVLDLGMTSFEVPIIAVDAPTENERKWLMRPGNDYANWGNLSNIMSQTDWAYVLGGFSSGAVGSKGTYCSLCGTHINNPASQTFVRFFVPTAMPTAYDGWDADHVGINVNGTQIFDGTHRSRTRVNYDFSNIIELNKPNYVAITWRASGGFGQDFGFYTPSTP
jgi:hypothetical protein